MMVIGVSGAGSPLTVAVPSAIRLNPSGAGGHRTHTLGRSPALVAALLPTTAEMVPSSATSTPTWMTRGLPSAPVVST